MNAASVENLPQLRSIFTPLDVTQPALLTPRQSTETLLDNGITELLGRDKKVIYIYTSTLRLTAGETLASYHYGVRRTVFAAHLLRSISSERNNRRLYS